MGGRTNRYGGQAGRDYRGDAALRPQREDERERPGPETIGERSGRVVELRDTFSLFQRQDMDDEPVDGGSPLRFVDSRDRLAVGRQIGSASSRDRVCQHVSSSVVAGALKKNKVYGYM